LVAWVIEGPFPDQTESLARRTSNHNRNLRVADPRLLPDVVTVSLGHASADGRTLGEVKFMRCAVDGVVLERSTEVESGLPESETQAARPGKQVHSDGFASHISIIKSRRTAARRMDIVH
jgi:hypothetical protein